MFVQLAFAEGVSTAANDQHQESNMQQRNDLSCSPLHLLGTSQIKFICAKSTQNKRIDKDELRSDTNCWFYI